MKRYIVTFKSGKISMVFACGFKHAHAVTRLFFPDDVGVIFQLDGAVIS